MLSVIFLLALIIFVAACDFSQFSMTDDVEKILYVQDTEEEAPVEETEIVQITQEENISDTSEQEDAFASDASVMEFPQDDMFSDDFMSVYNDDLATTNGYQEDPAFVDPGGNYDDDIDKYTEDTINDILNKVKGC